MARTFSAREMLSMLADENDEDDIELDASLTGNKNPGLKVAKSMDTQSDEEASDESPASEVTSNESKNENIEACDATEGEPEDEPISSRRTSVECPRSKRRSNRSPMPGIDGQDRGRSGSTEEWPTFNIRKSLKGEFEASPVKRDRKPGRRKKKSLVEDSMVEVELDTDAFADTSLLNDSQVDLTEVEKEFDSVLQDVYMCQAEAEAVMATLEDPWKEQKAFLMAKHKKQFPEWHFMLRMKMNVLVHGVGSKKDLLEEFRADELKLEPTLVIDGFDPDCEIESVFRDFLKAIGELETLPKEASETLAILRDFICETYECFNVILHNIDGVGLRSCAAQQLLSVLADIPQVHIIASIDHPNLPLLWSQSELDRFKWVHYQASTFADYQEFPIPDLTVREDKSSVVALTSLRHVFESLTANAKKVYREIAKFQVKDDNEDDDGAEKDLGMPYKELYRICRAEFLVSSDAGLRKQLVEFYDHDLLKSQRATNGQEYLRIPISSEALKKFLDTTLADT